MINIAVVDGDVNIWVAMWETGLVVCFNESGQRLGHIRLNAPNVTCPLVEGDRLFVTSAKQGLLADDLRKYPDSGKTFYVSLGRLEFI